MSGLEIGMALAATVLAQPINTTYELQQGAPAPIVVRVGDVPGADAETLVIQYSYSDVSWGLWPFFQAIWFRTGAVNGAGVIDAQVVDRSTGVVLAASVLQLQPNSWTRWEFPQPVDSRSSGTTEFHLRPRAGTDFEVDNLPVGNGTDMQRGIVTGWTQRFVSSWLNYLDADGGMIGSSYAPTSQVYEAAGVNDPFSLCGAQPMMFGNPYIEATEVPLDPSTPLAQSFAIGAWEDDVLPPVGVVDVFLRMANPQPFSWTLTASGVASAQGTATTGNAGVYTYGYLRPPYGFELPDPDGGPVSFIVTVQALDAGSTWTRLSIGEPGNDPCHPVVRATYGGALGRAIDDAGYGADYEFTFDDERSTSVFADDDDDGFGDGAKPLWISGYGPPYPPPGYAVTAGDCDDSNPSIHPGAAELCNGLDDNCNGLIDDADPALVLPGCELDAGVCAGAARPASTCSDGGWSACPTSVYGSTYQAVETACDGLDNDCDGFADSADPNLVVPACELDAGVCASAIRPLSTCTTGGWTACPPSAYGPSYEATEVTCDGLDNDCDGRVDDVAQAPLCAEQRGVCAGSRADVCSFAGWIACGPHEYGPHYEPVEVSCDGLDNDCDGLVDADDPDLVVPPCANRVGVCVGALHALSECTPQGWGACAGADYGADFEVTETRCDGLDNDCDGTIDEGCADAGTLPAAGTPAGPAAPSGCGCSSPGDALASLLALLALTSIGSRSAAGCRARANRSARSSPGGR